MKFIQANYTSEYYFKVPSEVNLDDENVVYWVKWNMLHIIVYKPNLTPEQKQDAIQPYIVKQDDENNILRKYQIEPSNDGNEDQKWPQEEIILDSKEDDWLYGYMTKEECEQEDYPVDEDDYCNCDPTKTDE